MELSLVIPACNEARRIRATLDAYLAALSGRDVEIIVVVNGSKDATESIIREEYVPAHPAVRMLVIPERVGKGGALIRGFSESRGRKIAYTDADGSTAPEALLSLVEQLHGDGVVIGSRWLADSRITRPQSRTRRAGSRGFNGAVRLLFGLRLHDTQCGAKVMSRPVLDAILPRIGCTDWAFDVDLLFQARRAGFPIQEIPIEWRHEDGSTFNIPVEALQTLAALVRLRLIYSPLKPLVNFWDNTLGIRLYRRRLARMRAIHGDVEP